METRKTTDSHHLTVQISSLLPASVCRPSSKETKEKAASLRVVHRYGPCSHLNPEKNNAPTVTQLLSHDESRINSIQSVITGKRNNLESKKSILPAKSGSSLGSGNYIVTIGLGTPKKELSLIFDTGSDLTWTQCQPCVKSCYKQQQPILDPSASTSYSNITCNSPFCSQLSTATGNTPSCSASTCVYGIQYGDQSFSVGYFAKEKLTLTSTDVIDGFLFGCGQNNQGLFGNTAGLLGLGTDKLSIVSQTAPKYGKFFSYCLPSMSSSTGHLSFGKTRVSRALQFTPLAKSQGASYYFIDIIAVYVGGTKLSISPTTFSTGGTIIDSGTVISRLPPSAYTSIKTAFKKLMTKYPEAPALSILDTCYDLSNYTTVSIPKLSFVFNGDVKVDIDPSGIVYGVSVSQVCLAFAGNSEDTDVGILGNVQQRTLEVVYDVAGGKLGFAPRGCA